MQMPPIMSKAANSLTRNFSASELLVHALVIELEAARSYKELAELMEQSGSTDVATIFAKMSRIETRHAKIIDEQLSDYRLPELTTWEFRWRGLEAPENIERARLQLQMTAHQALSLALDAEMRAYEFFVDVVDDSTDERVCELAAEFAAEEEQHIAWIEDWLAKAATSH